MLLQLILDVVPLERDERAELCEHDGSDVDILAISAVVSVCLRVCRPNSELRPGLTAVSKGSSQIYGSGARSTVPDMRRRGV